MRIKLSTLMELESQHPKAPYSWL